MPNTKTKENKNEKIRVQAQEDAHEAFLIFDEYFPTEETYEEVSTKIAASTKAYQKRTGASK